MEREHDRAQNGASIVGVALVVAAGAMVAVTVALAVRSFDEAADTSISPRTTTVSAVTEPARPISTAAPSTSTTTGPPATTTPTTTTSVPQPEPPAPIPPSYRAGDSGTEVAALQQRLVDLGIWLPAVDGNYGPMTAQGVMAFQKFIGLGRDGVAGPETLAALETSPPIGPREAGDHIEVDLDRQLMIVTRSGRSYVFNTSTGRSGWRTPPGRFQVTRQIDGVRHAPLGDLYRPKYFNGGIALHGSPSIPGHAASHGCTRLHDAAVDLIWTHDLAPIGTPVWVY